MHYLCNGDTGEFRPILIAGPVGCGKTRGLELILHALGVDTFTIDACFRPRPYEDVGPGDVQTSLREIYGTRTFKGRRAILLEGINGFTSDAIHEVVQHVKRKCARATSVILLFATCVDAWDMKLSSLREWKHFTLYTPSERGMCNFAEHKFPGHPQRIYKTVVAQSSGDLHTLLQAMARVVDNDTFDTDGKDLEQNVFQITRQLLDGSARPAVWTESAYNFDVVTFGSHPQLLFHNYLGFTDDLANACRFSDSMSLAATRPDVHLSHLAQVASGMMRNQGHVTLKFPRVQDRPRSSDPSTRDVWLPLLLRDRVSSE